MKRIISVLCAAVLAACLCGTAWAGPVDYTLDEKLTAQLQSSGLKGTVSFTADGDGFWGIDGVQWAWIGTLLKTLTLDVKSTVLAYELPDRETQLTVNRDGAAAGQADILNDGDLYAFSSDLIGGGVYYGMSRNADLKRLLRYGGGNAWPGVLHIFHELANADQKWQERASVAAADYMTKLGIWFQSYQKVSMQLTNGELTVTQRCAIPGNDVKTEIKQLLVDLYGDPEMLGLLAEVFTPEESAAYLQPAMMNTFFTLLDGVDIESDVVIERMYDSHGTCLNDTVTLPFTRENRLAHVTVSIKGAETEAGMEKEYAVTGAYRDSDDPDTLYPFMISVIPFGTEGIYNGSVSIAYPLPESDGFQVVEDAPSSGTLEAEFALGVDMGEETYNAAEDLCMRERSITLTVRPMTGDTTSFHTMSLSVYLVMSSRSRMEAPTTVTASVTLTDQELGGYIGMEANFKTASRWTPTRISDLEDVPIRIDTMSAGQLDLTYAEWFKNLMTWVGANLLKTGN